jgi:outer membrane lipoprotein-sorting protein
VTRVLVQAAAALTLAASSPARALPVEPLLQRLEKSGQAVETLAGSFTQRSRIKLFKRVLESTGRFYYQRPRRIRWEYLSPDPSTLVLDGDRAVLRSPGAAPQSFDLAKDATMRAVFDQLSLWLGAGSPDRLKQEYDVAAEGSDAEPRLVLAPRAASAVARAFTRIELRFDKALLLRGITMREPSGDEKEIVFGRIERNVKLPPDAF